LPTTWLEVFNIQNDLLMRAFYTEDLFLYENSCYDFLNEIIKIADVIIITNAEDRWVEESCQEYLPKIWPIISTIKIVSAYDSYIKIVDCPFKWKELAFKNEIELYLKDNLNNQNNLKNIVSIGDAEYERSAIKTISVSCHIKSIKLSDKPFLTLLKNQLDIMTKNIKNIIEENNSLDLILLPKSTEPVDQKNVYNPNDFNLLNEVIII